MCSAVRGCQRDRKDEKDVGRIERIAEPVVEKCRREQSEPTVDARCHSDLTDEVEPTGEPAPSCSVLATELRRPVVETPAVG